MDHRNHAPPNKHQLSGRNHQYLGVSKRQVAAVGYGKRPLTFPAHLLHGWYFHTRALHLQAVSESYADYGCDDNLGVHWSDPELGIPWDFADPILSPRAAGFGSLAALRSELAGRRPPAPES